MIKIVLVILALVAIIGLTIYLVKTHEKIESYIKNHKTVGTDPSGIGKFAWQNRFYVLAILAVVACFGGVTNNAISDVNKATIVIRDSSQMESDSMCLNRMEALDKEKILIASICEVESGDNEKCPGGGCMQITKVCVDAANRLQRKEHFDYADRYDREQSAKIWRIIQTHCNKSGDIEKAIRLWNGGPGYTTAGTQGYYEKVMRVYNRKIDEHLQDICKQYKSLSL